MNAYMYAELSSMIFINGTISRLRRQNTFKCLNVSPMKSSSSVSSEPDKPLNLIVMRELDPSSTLVLARLFHHYNSISLFAANLGTISLTFTALAVAGTDGLTEESSAVVAILMSAMMAAIVAILLRFTLNRSKPCFQRLDLIAASTPLFLADLAVLDILVGLLVWYTSSFTSRFAMYLGIELLVLMTLMVFTAIWVWRKITILIPLNHFNCVETGNAVGGR
ncbi:hypothetical protein FBEOM_14695 [Fusarium beomiforme]|uniref:Transmembrane protein n=1 Tax=Fusarium beomiforme TaxID=44412 RepID=A0A9P5DKN1_9HYPO|nr:hypothetical protein FBEOM_14695 [Fusarium beomiforme]